MNPKKENSVVGEAQRGDSSYNHLDMAQPTALDPKSTGGVVGTPSIGGDYVQVPQKSADTTNSDTTLNTTYDHTNLGAKWGYPNVSQDVPEKGRNQYEDHS